MSIAKCTDSQSHKPTDTQTHTHTHTLRLSNILQACFKQFHDEAFQMPSHVYSKVTKCSFELLLFHLICEWISMARIESVIIYLYTRILPDRRACHTMCSTVVSRLFKLNINIVICLLEWVQAISRSYYMLILWYLFLFFSDLFSLCTTENHVRDIIVMVARWLKL